MGDPALNKPNEPLATTGFEDFYAANDNQGTAQEQPGCSSGTASEPQAPPGTAQGIAQWLSVEEAARRLNISPNAVIKRLGKGKLAGHKIPGQYGERWVVDPSAVPQKIDIEVEGYDQGTAQEQPGSSSGTASEPQASPGIASESLKVLAQVIQIQNEQLKAQNDLIQHLTGELRERDSQIKLLTSRQYNRPAWHSFWCWLIGR